MMENPNETKKTSLNVDGNIIVPQIKFPLTILIGAIKSISVSSII